MSKEEKFYVKKVNKSSKTLRFPDDLIIKMQAIADSKEISFNELAVQCCEFAIKRLADSNDEKLPKQS